MEMQSNWKSQATPSTTTFTIEEETPGNRERSLTKGTRLLRHSLRSSRSGNREKFSGRKSMQEIVSMGKRSEVKLQDKKPSGKLETFGRRLFRRENSTVEQREASGSGKNMEKLKQTLSKGAFLKNGSNTKCLQRDTPIATMHECEIKQTSSSLSMSSPKMESSMRKNVLSESASTVRLSRSNVPSLEAQSVTSNSTFIVDFPNSNATGRENNSQDSVDSVEKRKMARTKEKKVKRKKRKTHVSFKIYSRCIPKNVRNRWRECSSAGSTEEETSQLPVSRVRFRSDMTDRVSEPWMRKGFTWKSQRERGRSALSINSSLGHMNCDEAEDFFCWERVPTEAITFAWETFLYKWKKCWSELSMEAFRKNRLSDTPGEILELLKDGNGLSKRGNSRYSEAPEELSLSSPFDIEPSIYQKNIDVRNWLEALRFQSCRAEEFN